MTIHSVMPLELVLDGMNDNRKQISYIEVQTPEMRLLLEPLHPGVGRIVRLLDCRLDAYLRPELSPGMLYVYGTGHAPSCE